MKELHLRGGIRTHKKQAPRLYGVRRVKEEAQGGLDKCMYCREEKEAMHFMREMEEHRLLS